MKNKTLALLKKSLLEPWWIYKKGTIISQKVMKGFFEASHHLPKVIRNLVLSTAEVFTIIVFRTFSVICQTHLTASVIHGREHHSGTNLTILLLSNEESIPYLTNLLFSKKPTIKKIGTIYIWNIKKIVNKFYSKIDAVVIKCDRFYAQFLWRNNFFVIPEGISMVLDVSKPLEKIYDRFTKSAKEDIRKVKKYGYSYEITSDSDKLHLFYYKMYLPYAYWRHEKLTLCDNFYIVRYLFEKGYKLMLIKQGHEYVSGTLFSIKKDVVTGTHAGVMEGKFNHLHSGVSAAYYYFLLQWAKKKGFKYLNLGNCHAFLNDGLFRYKRKWGTTIEKNENKTRIYAFKPCNHNKGIQNFLIHNPFICMDEKQFKGMIFIPKNHAVVSVEKHPFVNVFRSLDCDVSILTIPYELT